MQDLPPCWGPEGLPQGSSQDCSPFPVPSPEEVMWVPEPGPGHDVASRAANEAGLADANKATRSGTTCGGLEASAVGGNGAGGIDGGACAGANSAGGKPGSGAKNAGGKGVGADSGGDNDGGTHGGGDQANECRNNAMASEPTGQHTLLGCKFASTVFAH